MHLGVLCTEYLIHRPHNNFQGLGAQHCQRTEKNSKKKPPKYLIFIETPATGLSPDTDNPPSDLLLSASLVVRLSVVVACCLLSLNVMRSPTHLQRYPRVEQLAFWNCMNFLGARPYLCCFFR